MNERFRLRAGFDSVAGLYDLARPGYPDRMFRDLASLTGVGPGRRVLEIGCGTGQASLPLAGLGCSLQIVELGARLAEIAALKLSAYSPRIFVADFDHWTPDSGRFDLIFSAMAFHWLDPETRYRRTAEMLAPLGFLVTVGNGHIEGGTQSFFREVQSIYRRYDPAITLDDHPKPAAEIPHQDSPGLSPYYQPPVFFRYEWETTYTTAEYITLLRTYSGTYYLGRPAQEGLLRDIATLIDGRYGGRIVKRNMTELRVAQVARTG